MSEKNTHYHVPDASPWPIAGALIMGALMLGAGNFIQTHSDSGIPHAFGGAASAMAWLFPVAIFAVFCLMYVWFRDTVRESLAGMNSTQMDHSYRQGMSWFIFSEVMFFAAFFGALFYTRWLSVPWLGGEGSKHITHELLWPHFQALWPLVKTPDGRTLEAMGAWGLPAINTAILLTSSLTVTLAHHALLKGNRGPQILWLLATVTLGVIFLSLQAYEYHHAWTEMGLTLSAGIYGSTFFMLTGFHGMHVTIGTIMLAVMLIRSLNPQHLTPNNHFAFEAAAWYWHFVDVVWLFLFICVYWL